MYFSLASIGGPSDLSISFTPRFVRFYGPCNVTSQGLRPELGPTGSGWPRTSAALAGRGRQRRSSPPPPALPGVVGCDSDTALGPTRTQVTAHTGTAVPQHRIRKYHFRAVSREKTEFISSVHCLLSKNYPNPKSESSHQYCIVDLIGLENEEKIENTY